MRLMLGILVGVLLVTPRPIFAQGTAPAPDPRQPFVDINLFAASTSAARDRNFTFRVIRFGEVASSVATYPKPSVSTSVPIDIGGGVMLRRTMGIGVSYSRTAYEDPVGLEATIPHPTFFNVNASDIDVTNQSLRRKEAAVNLFFAVVPVYTDRLQFRLLGGPSFYSYSAEMVQEIRFAQAFDPLAPQNSITINGFGSQEATGHRFGFHAGADVTYFLNRLVGVAGGVRFGMATVRLSEEPLSQLTQDIRVGGTTVFLGIRFRPTN